MLPSIFDIQEYREDILVRDNQIDDCKYQIQDLQNENELLRATVDDLRIKSSLEIKVLEEELEMASSNKVFWQVFGGLIVAALLIIPSIFLFFYLMSD